MTNLSDEALVKAYIESRDLNLNSDFIHAFKKEIDERGLCLDNFDLTSIE